VLAADTVEIDFQKEFLERVTNKAARFFYCCITCGANSMLIAFGVGKSPAGRPNRPGCSTLTSPQRLAKQSV